jgi:hypothetical protein
MTEWKGFGRTQSRLIDAVTRNLPVGLEEITKHLGQDNLCATLDLNLASPKYH